MESAPAHFPHAARLSRLRETMIELGMIANHLHDARCAARASLAHQLREVLEQRNALPWYAPGEHAGIDGLRSELRGREAQLLREYHDQDSTFWTHVAPIHGRLAEAVADFDDLAGLVESGTSHRITRPSITDLLPFLYPNTGSTREPGASRSALEDRLP